MDCLDEGRAVTFDLRIRGREVSVFITARKFGRKRVEMASFKNIFVGKANTLEPLV